MYTGRLPGAKRAGEERGRAAGQSDLLVSGLKRLGHLLGRLVPAPVSAIIFAPYVRHWIKMEKN
jgi:hypothetical protein